MATKRTSRGTSGGSSSGESRPENAKRTETQQDLLPDEGDLLEFADTASHRAIIKVVGCGGGGGNALNNMVVSGLAGVDFIAANTDAQALQHNRAPIKVQLGSEVTRGLGCGADPNKGRESALEVRERLGEAFAGTDMVFVTAGLGGGTGTGAAPIVAEVAKEAGALTVGVVTKPFLFEGKVRMKHAERGLEELHRVVDTVITIPNQRLLALAGKGTAMRDAFKLADDVLFNAVRGISDLITIHGLINLDFADVRTIMNEMGVALMGTGTAIGDERAEDAARMAISSPLLEDLSIDGAHGVLINITGGSDLSLFEVNEASTLIQEAAHEDANIIFGAVIDESMPDGEMRVTVIATGLVDDRMRRGRDDSAREIEDHSNVTPLRREPVPAETTTVTAETRPEPIPVTVPGPDVAEPAAAPGQDQGDDFLSPFEDELDVPTFLRRQGATPDDEDEDRETPAFLRRSAD
ncbi:MAG: cell division protein FtsZ [Thermoleophilia bacterium]|nr:cell division protein FtsZ [Thermoleophilia bacterium]